MTDFSQQRIYKHRLLTCFSYLVSVFSGCKWCLLTNCISGAVVVQFRPSPGCLEVSGHDWIKISFLFCLAAVFLSHLFDHTTEFWLLWTRLLQFRLNGDCFLVILKISVWLLSGRFSCSCWLEEKNQQRLFCPWLPSCVRLRYCSLAFWGHVHVVRAQQSWLFTFFLFKIKTQNQDCL